MRRMSAYYFGEGASPDAAVPDALSSGEPSIPASEWSPAWDQPYNGSGATVDTSVGTVPYYLADPSKVDIDPLTGIPTHLQAAPFELPKWFWPVAIGATAFVLLGGGALIFSRRKRRR